MQTASRKALRELIDLLAEVDERWAGPEWNLGSEADVATAHRALMHVLEAGLVTMFESDPDHPVFRPIVTSTRKLTGDNPDAIYFDAPVRPDRTYRVRGTTAGAVYVSITVEVPDHLVLSNEELTGTQVHEACLSITADAVTVKAGANISLTSPSVIVGDETVVENTGTLDVNNATPASCS